MLEIMHSEHHDGNYIVWVKQSFANPWTRIPIVECLAMVDVSLDINLTFSQPRHDYCTFTEWLHLLHPHSSAAAMFDRGHLSPRLNLNAD